VLWIHHYTLKPRGPLNARAGAAPRPGALLRVDGGFADIHPWPELGDEPLEKQLLRLALGETTPLTARSLAMARLDGEARAAGRSLFDGLEMAPSHWPHAAGEVPEGFDTVKVKLGPGARVPDGFDAFKLRLDFNATLTPPQFETFVNTLTRWNAIEFVEDPCPYDATTWSRLREQTVLPLALDRGVATGGVDVLVVKPAVQELAPALATGLDVVVTSYMDHPVGQLHAAYAAATVAAEHPRQVRQAGLLTHLLFQRDAFLEQVALDGNRLAKPSGSGIGFDDLLARLPWKQLSL
jgi:O-succinylbenzoate synthase